MQENSHDPINYVLKINYLKYDNENQSCGKNVKPSATYRRI